MNTHVRDQFNDLDPRTTVKDGLLALTDTTTNTSYGNLATNTGPAVTVVTGTIAVVVITASLSNDTSNAATYMSVAVTGATTSAATDALELTHQSPTAGASAFMSAVFLFNVSAGSNTFTAKYRISSGTGSVGQARLIVWPGNKLS